MVICILLSNVNGGRIVRGGRRGVILAIIGFVEMVLIVRLWIVLFLILPDLGKYSGGGWSKGGGEGGREKGKGVCWIEVLLLVRWEERGGGGREERGEERSI